MNAPASRALRVTMYAPHDLHPTTVIVREQDIEVPIEELIASQPKIQPGLFVVTDVFESAGDLARTTVVGAGRVRPEERNMAISYYWNAEALRRTKPGGVLVNPAPAPLNAADVTVVLRQLAVHPNYSPGVTLLQFTSDMEQVSMKDGVVTNLGPVR